MDSPYFSLLDPAAGSISFFLSLKRHCRVLIKKKKRKKIIRRDVTEAKLPHTGPCPAWARLAYFWFRGTWCSGITSAPHAEGPGLNPQCVHAHRCMLWQQLGKLVAAAWQRPPVLGQDRPKGRPLPFTGNADLPFCRLTICVTFSVEGWGHGR